MSGLILAAKSVKAELQQKFPAIKFSVRSKTYSGGNSIHVVWANGPTREEVQAITQKYEEGDFDGMTDSYVRNEDPQRLAFQAIRGSAKYVMLHRRAA